MFLPPKFRPLIVGLYLWLSWKFLSLGAILWGTSWMLASQGQLEAMPTIMTGSFLLYVGILTLRRLGSVMSGPAAGL